MVKHRAKNLPDTVQVEPSRALIVRGLTIQYNRRYTPAIVFDSALLRLNATSWLWTMLEDLAAESEVVRAPSQEVLALKAAVEELAADPVAHGILAQSPEQLGPADIRRLFQRGEFLADARGDSPAGQRQRIAFRAFVFDRANIVPFAEPVDEQRVLFKPKLPTQRGTPRALISDFNDLRDPKASLPVGALPSNSAQELVRAVKARSEYDLTKIRDACIAEMAHAAEVRVRAARFRQESLPHEVEELVRRALRRGKQGKRIVDSSDLGPEKLLSAVLSVIAIDGLATADAPYVYDIPRADELRKILFEGRPPFRSRRIFEIEHRGCVEEIFAAFHLLHTHAGWNWSSVMALREDQLDFSTPGHVILQGYKSKTDDDTPYVSIELSEPGVETAVNILRWNRAKLVDQGFLDHENLVLWATRPTVRSLQEDYVFHPALRLHDFIKRHGLPKYSFDQVRTQYLFHRSLTKGGIETARLRGGHAGYGATESYVGNVIQDRLSSALNLEFSKKLEKEIVYLYGGGSRFGPAIQLLRPIGDGASCIDPAHPPPRRSQRDGECDAHACHADGGCPHRRIAINDLRVEEVVRLHRHYTATWQRSWQDNPQRFVAHVLPSLAFNAGLMQALRNGPYGARVQQIESQVSQS